MNIEEAIKICKKAKKPMYHEVVGSEWIKGYTSVLGTDLDEAIETLLTAYEKEKEKNKNAIDFINERKKTVNKDMAEGTRLQVGTFMWQVDELLEILKGVEEE